MQDKLEGEELNILIKRSQNGDEEALEKVVLAYQGLIVKVVRSHFLSLSEIYNRTSTAQLDFDDLVSVAQISLIQTIRTFDIAKNSSFISSVSFRIKHALFKYVKKQQGPVYLPDHIFEKRRTTATKGKTTAAPSPFRPVPSPSGESSTWTEASRCAISLDYTSIELVEETALAAPDANYYEYELFKEEILNLIERAFSYDIKLAFALKMEGFSCKEIQPLVAIPQKRLSRIFRFIVGETTNLDELYERLRTIKGENYEKSHDRKRTHCATEIRPSEKMLMWRENEGYTSEAAQNGNQRPRKFR